MSKLDMSNPVDAMVARLMIDLGLIDTSTIERLPPEGEEDSSPYAGDVDVPPIASCIGCGACCRSAPGATVPADLGPDLQSEAARRLATGQWTIDWWDGDVDEDGGMPRIYVLRPAQVGHEGKVFHPGWGGACTLLGPNGCTLSRAERPTQCKALVPHPTRYGCEGMTKGQIARAWRPYSDALHAVGVALQTTRGD